MSTLKDRIRRRYAPMLLLVAAGAAAYFLIPHVPRERTLELRLDDAATVTAIDLAWTPAGAGEAVQGGAWHFAAGKAPSSLTTPVRLPDGRYTLDLSVERTAQREVVQRVIVLGEADRITVRVR